MNPEHKELAEKVIGFFKKSDKTNLIPADDLSILIKEQEIMKSVIYSLEKDFGLIERSGKHSFRLTKKGWKFSTFDQLEKDSKKTPLTLYQKSQLVVMTLSLIAVITLGILNYSLAREKSALKDENAQLKSDVDTYKDSINGYKEKALQQTKDSVTHTSQSKSYPDVKVDNPNNKKRLATMYNRNYGGFDCVRIHSELLRSVLNRKFLLTCP